MVFIFCVCGEVFHTSTHVRSGKHGSNNAAKAHFRITGHHEIGRRSYFDSSKIIEIGRKKYVRHTD